MVSAVVADDHRRRDIVDRLLLLTTKLPDSAVFTTLRLDQSGEVRLSGYAAEGSRTASALGLVADTVSGRPAEAAVDTLSPARWIRFTLIRVAGGGS
jgi:hypothetical protein